MKRIRSHAKSKPTRGEKTVSVCRGQTTQDFAVGIGIFILAVAAVFATVPTFITPFDTSTGSAEVAQADRIANVVIDNISTEESSHPNNVSADKFDEYSGNSAALAERLGLRADTDDNVPFDRVNITITPHDDTDDIELAAGDNIDGATTVTTERIVSVDGLDDHDAYRLVVRVW